MKTSIPLFVYTAASDLMASLDSGVSPCDMTGANAVFFASSWSKPSLTTAFLNALRKYGKPVILSLGGSTSTGTIRDLVSEARSILGGSLVSFMLRDEPDCSSPDVINDLKREALAFKSFAGDVPLGINVTLSPKNYPVIHVPGIDWISLDGYYNEGTFPGDIRQSCSAWLAAMHPNDTRPLWFIGMAHSYKHPNCTVNLTEDVMLMWLDEVRGAWGNRLGGVGLYCWRRDITATDPNGQMYTQFHPMQNQRVREACLEFSKKFYALGLSGRIVLPIPSQITSAYVAPKEVVMRPNSIRHVSLIDAGTLTVVKVEGDLTLHENIPPGLKNWTVNSRAKTGNTIIKYTLSDGSVIEQPVTVEANEEVQVTVRLPPGATKIIINLEK